MQADDANQVTLLIVAATADMRHGSSGCCDHIGRRWRVLDVRTAWCSDGDGCGCSMRRVVSEFAFDIAPESAANTTARPALDQPSPRGPIASGRSLFPRSSFVRV